MDREQAKEILLRYRPGTRDEEDTDVRAALDQASRDPELAVWLGKHREFQQQAHQKFQSLEVPAGLREQILSERKVRLSTWRSPRRLAVGALAVALAALGLFIWFRPGPEPEARFATFRSRMVKTALRGYGMDLKTNDLAKIRTYLRAQKAEADWESPQGLEATPLLGCAVLPWRSKPAAMICYGRGTLPSLWLFVVNSDAFPDPPSESVRTVQKVNQLNTVSWTSNGRTYLLAGDLGETELLRLLNPGS